MASMIAQRCAGVQLKATPRVAPRAIPALRALPVKPGAKQVRPLILSQMRFLPRRPPTAILSNVHPQLQAAGPIVANRPFLAERQPARRAENVVPPQAASEGSAPEPSKKVLFAAPAVSNVSDNPLL